MGCGSSRSRVPTTFGVIGFRGFGVNNNARIYEAVAIDSEDKKSILKVAFNSLLSPEKMDVLEQLQSTPTSGGGLRPVSRLPPVKWEWYDRLVLFCIGAGIGEFIFCAILDGSLAPPNRPFVPDPGAGYTYLFSGAKYRNVYGTFFEYWVVTYGIWLWLGISGVSSLFAHILDIRHISPTYPRQIFAGAVISFVLYYAMWRVFFSGA